MVTIDNAVLCRLVRKIKLVKSLGNFMTTSVFVLILTNIFAIYMLIRQATQDLTYIYTLCVAALINLVQLIFVIICTIYVKFETYNLLLRKPVWITNIALVIANIVISFVVAYQAHFIAILIPLIINLSYIGTYMIGILIYVLHKDSEPLYLIWKNSRLLDTTLKLFPNDGKILTDYIDTDITICTECHKNAEHMIFTTCGHAIHYKCYVRRLIRYMDLVICRRCNSCNWCNRENKYEQPVYTLECGHHFDVNCYAKIKSQNIQCPVCRHQ